jgi:PIN domain nuclease of toxin-antitoxin system
MRILLDTNAVVFFADDSPRLSERAYDLIGAAETEVFVSAVTGAELACLCRRKDFELAGGWKQWFRGQLTVNNWHCLPITLDILEEAYSLPEPVHRDPADRILIATTRLNGMILVTTDQLILEYPHVQSMS